MLVRFFVTSPLRLTLAVACASLAFGASAQIKPELRKAERSNWSYVLTYSGNDSYQDNEAAFPKTETVPWDIKRGSRAMNGCDWLRSAWYGSMAKLCSVTSIGTVKGILVWQGAGPAPKDVSVRISSALIARFSESQLTPSVYLSNGLGSRSNTCRVNGAFESTAADSSVIRLPVQNGSASFSFGLTGRVSGLMTGAVALHSEFSAKAVE